MGKLRIDANGANRPTEDTLIRFVRMPRFKKEHFREQFPPRPFAAVEQRRRLQTISTSLDEIAGARLRQRRGIEMLELIDVKNARELLKALAAGATEARLTEQATAALVRFDKPMRKR